LKGRLLSYTTISGPCLDHASLYLREKFKSEPSNVFKMLTKSWYIGAFHFPLLGPTVWKFFTPERWGKVLTGLEKMQGLPLSQNISADGKYGISLYRANFLPTLTQSRQRYAQCSVQAIILKQDSFVSPEYISEAMPRWVERFETVELDANHWAILSQPKKVAALIHQFIQRQTH
jgi:hypothetical protein